MNLVKHLVMIALPACMLSACTPAKNGGDSAGNGGDVVAMEFQAAAKRALEFAKLNPDTTQALDTDALERKITTTHVTSTDKTLTLRGDEKDAINYPAEGRIVVNRPRWRMYQPGKRIALALHEYLGLMGIDDSTYNISAQVLEYDPVTLLPLHNRTDILIVIDNSGSMQDSQNQLSDHVYQIWNEIRTRGLDFHIGVITTDMADDGRLIGSITAATPDGLNKLQNLIKVGTQGSNEEHEFDPVFRSFAWDNRNGPNHGFFRRSATLELILLTDEDDQSYGFTPLQFAEKLWAFKGDPSRVYATGFIKGNDSPRLTEFLRLVDGDIEDATGSVYNVSVENLRTQNRFPC